MVVVCGQSISIPPVILAPGDVLLSDNGECWEPRHLVTSAPERYRERQRQRTDCSARDCSR